MTSPDDVLLRSARPGDAAAVAGLHADSWRHHYRGAFSDAFLDGDVAGYQLARWTGRLGSPDPRASTIVAELGGNLVGFAHTQLDDDAAWGALLDNLHVSSGLKRLGIGTRLLALTAQAVLERSPGSGLYLWVLEQNVAAQAFYAARGGSCVETAEVSPPGGEPDRLNGSPRSFRFVWPDPARLLLFLKQRRVGGRITGRLHGERAAVAGRAASARGVSAPRRSGRPRRS
ncbi:MAG TPA: GNAT family N-acetyltransferase [Trebonia sp.]|nr:GNAT family N-acetyltransferase [Trebonia sp.]